MWHPTKNGGTQPEDSYVPAARGSGCSAMAAQPVASNTFWTPGPMYSPKSAGSLSAAHAKAEVASVAVDLLLPIDAWQLSGMRTMSLQTRLLWAAADITNGGVQVQNVGSFGKPVQTSARPVAPAAHSVLRKGLGS
jgi:hypothetical protein